MSRRLLLPWIVLVMLVTEVAGIRQELQAATTRPSARPTSAKPTVIKPTNFPTEQPSDYPTFPPSSSPTDVPTLAPQLPVIAAKSQQPPPPVAIIVSVWVIFCACGGVCYFYYRRLQRKIAESDQVGDYVVTEDGDARAGKGTATFVEEDTQMNPLQFAGTSDTAKHDDINRNFASIGDDDEEYLADEDLL